MARLRAENGDPGVGKPVGDEAAVDRGGDRPDGLADDHDLRGVRKALNEVVERGRAVDEAFVLDGQAGRVLPPDVAEVRSTGAGRHIDEAVVAEGIVGAGEV